MDDRAREELVERVALAVAPYMGCEDCGTGPGECPCRDAARAALAVIEPVVREECAKVAEHRWRDWPNVHPDDAKTGQVCDDVTACADIAAAIRGGSNGE